MDGPWTGLDRFAAHGGRAWSSPSPTREPCLGGSNNFFLIQEVSSMSRLVPRWCCFFALMCAVYVSRIRVDHQTLISYARMQWHGNTESYQKYPCRRNRYWKEAGTEVLNWRLSLLGE